MRQKLLCRRGSAISGTYAHTHSHICRCQRCQHSPTRTLAQVDATGLNASSDYTYEFKSKGSVSPLGRTKTLPEEDADISSLKIAVMSCSHYLGGYFNAYGAIAAKADELDFALHLGDYIYEYQGVYDGANDELLQKRVGAVHSPNGQTVTLADYRARYQQYRGDSQSKDVSAALPFIFVPDDHEVANDAYDGGAENHDEATQGAYALREAAGLQAMFEYQPIRQMDAADTRIYRDFRVGNLVNLMMLNTRFDGRKEQANQFDLATQFDPAQTLIGEEQMQWLGEQLKSDATWKVMGNQMAFTPFNDILTFQASGMLFPFTTDMWDGYRISRQRVINEMEENTIILTGDAHWAISSEIPCNTLGGDAPTGPRFVSSSKEFSTLCFTFILSTCRVLKRTLTSQPLRQRARVQPVRPRLRRQPVRPPVLRHALLPVRRPH